jgi:AraC family transcriptional regulator
MRLMLAGFFSLIAFFALGLLIKLGWFKPVSIDTKEMGPFVFVYQDFVGPYHKTQTAIQLVEDWAKKNGETCELSFGQYLDNPEIIEEIRLRSRGGCIVQNSPSSLPENFKVLSLPSQKFVVAEFSGSAALGPQKIYPKVDEYFAQARLNKGDYVLEIYKLISEREMSTTYLFPIITPNQNVNK